MRKVAISPGWYAVANSQRKVLNTLADAGIEIVYSFLYNYVKVTEGNRQIFEVIVRNCQTLRVKDIEVNRLINLAIANAAVKRYPGSKKEGQFTKEGLLNLLEKQKHECVACKDNITCCYTVDHIIPSSRGGSNSLDNIQLLCDSCNSSKGDRTMDEWQSWKFGISEVKKRGATPDGFSPLNEDLFLIARWLRDASAESGIEPTMPVRLSHTDPKY